MWMVEFMPVLKIVFCLEITGVDADETHWIRPTPGLHVVYLVYHEIEISCSAFGC
jgi:hypothetical protein